MNAHTKRRQVSIAIALLIEVVAEILQEAQDNDEDGLQAEDVARRAGFPEQNRGSAARYVLALMRDQGLAVNDQPGFGPGAWRLVNQAED